MLYILSCAADIIQMFLRHGQDVNAKSRDGKTCLELACKSEDLKTVKLLLDAGAKIPKSLLDEVLRRGFFEIADVIAKHSENK